MKVISIELADSAACSADPCWWKRLMSLFLKPGHACEIRCWREEQEIAAKALSYGMRAEEACTRFEVSIRGTLTHSVIHDILDANRPREADRMTEFFTITVENVVSSEHYGKEIYVFDPTEEVRGQISAILTPIRQYFILGESGKSLSGFSRGASPL